MIQRKKKICKDCDTEQYIWSKNRCKRCDAIFRLDKQKEQEKEYKKSCGKCDTCTCKKSKIKKKSTTSVKSKDKKSTGELEMFKEIWKERPHVSQISGKALVNEDHAFWIWQFAHVLGKGAYPDKEDKWRLNKKNIWLVTAEEHFDLTNNSCRHKEEYKEYFEYHDKLKQEYYNN